MEPVPSRKPKKAVTDPGEIDDILRRGDTLRLAMCRDDQPYLVVLNYGYDGRALYLHTGRQGLKMEFIRANPKVCFEVTLGGEILKAETPCAFNCAYESVIGFGRVALVEEAAERIRGLKAVVAQCGGDAAAELPPEKLALTQILRIDIDHLTGKRNQPQAEVD